MSKTIEQEIKELCDEADKNLKEYFAWLEKRSREIAKGKMTAHIVKGSTVDEAGEGVDIGQIQHWLVDNRVDDVYLSKSRNYISDVIWNWTQRTKQKGLL